MHGDDLRAFKPAMEDLLKSGEIRIVEVIAPDDEGFGPGGLIEDLKLGLGGSNSFSADGFGRTIGVHVRNLGSRDERATVRLFR